MTESDDIRSEKFDKIVRGTHEDLEREADDLLLNDRKKNITKYSEMREILLPYQIKTRVRKEVYVNNGTPQESIVSGVFGRVHHDTKRKASRNDIDGGVQS